MRASRRPLSIENCQAIGTVAVLAALAVFPGRVDAQNFGLRGGIERTQIVTNVDSGTLGTETGYSFGLFLRVPLPYHFDIQGEGMYSQKIVTQQNLELAAEGSFEPNASLRLGYLEIPVTLGYRIPVPGPVKPRLYAGPVIGVVVNESIDLEGKSSSDIANESVLLTRDAFSDREVGWMTGVGASMKLGPLPLHLTFDMRYTGGLSTVSEDFAGNPLSRQVKMGALSGLIGLGF